MREFLQLATSEPIVEAESSDDDDGTQMPDEKPASMTASRWKPSNMQKGVIGIAAVVVVIVLALILWPSSTVPQPDNQDSIPNKKAEIIEAVVPTTVTNKACHSPLGDYRYTGPIDTDGNPHGIGDAEFDESMNLDAKGRVVHRLYKGPFVHGTMQGTNSYFRMNNGDIFEGEFRDNRFYKGRYTIKEDGSYFQGSFKDGQPDKGNWYDKNGKQL